MEENFPEENIQNSRRRTGINDVGEKFITDLIEEKSRVGDDLPIISMLIDEAIEKVERTGRTPGKEFLADVYNQKPIKVSQTVLVPVKVFPKFNFCGKILGPKGNSLRRLQHETQCKIVIKGRNSMANRAKEEELRASGDPRHAHLNKNLFLVISTVGVPAECYARIAYALTEIRKYLIPDKNDDVSQQQMQEIMNDPELANSSKAIAYNKSKSARGGQSNGKFQKYMNLVHKSLGSGVGHHENAGYKNKYKQNSGDDIIEEQEEEEQEEEPDQNIPEKKSLVMSGYRNARVPSKGPEKRVAAPPQFAAGVKRKVPPNDQSPYTLRKKN